MTSFEVYLLTRLDAVRTLAEIACFVSALWLGITIIATNIDDLIDDNPPFLLRWKTPTVLLSLAATALVLIPTTKECAAIYLLPKVMNNEQVQELPNNSLKLLNTKLEEWMQESLTDDDKEKP